MLIFLGSGQSIAWTYTSSAYAALIHSSAQLFGRIKAPAFSLAGMDRPEHMQ
jgi:hypothetical protein